MLGKEGKRDNLSRDELLETGGSFTVKELREFALGKEVIPGGRESLYISDEVPVRLIPSNLSITAEELYRDGDIKSPIELLRSGYNLYRGCVNRGFEVPLALNNDAYEWPEPSLFPWNDVEGVSLAAFALSHGEPGKVLSFKIKRLGDVRMMNLVDWQNLSNRVFARGLSDAVQNLRTCVENSLDVAGFLEYIFCDLRGSVKLPVLRYARANETPSCGNMLAREL